MKISLLFVYLISIMFFDRVEGYKAQNRLVFSDNRKNLYCNLCKFSCPEEIAKNIAMNSYTDSVYKIDKLDISEKEKIMSYEHILLTFNYMNGVYRAAFDLLNKHGFTFVEIKYDVYGNILNITEQRPYGYNF